jgi:hypothetical protein
VDKPGEGIFELENVPIETSTTEKQREKNDWAKKIQWNTQESWGSYNRYSRRREKQKKYFKQ